MSLVGFKNRENGYNKIIDPDQDVELYKQLMRDVDGWRYLGTVSDMSTADVVNHPPHYTSHPSGIEVIQITEHMNFCLGNAVKYILRCDHKGNAVEDLKKAIWYINRELERREPGSTKNPRQIAWLHDPRTNESSAVQGLDVIDDLNDLTEKLNEVIRHINGEKSE